MPPRTFSRYMFCQGRTDSEGRRYLTERAPFRFRDADDNTTHTVTKGDTIWGLAGRYFYGFTERPCGLWWILADFQPQPIIDPTLELEVGSIIYIPSLKTIRQEVFAEARRVLSS